MSKEILEYREALKKWNDKRAEAEKKGLEKFYKLNSDPILHPSKQNKNQ